MPPEQRQGPAVAGVSKAPDVGGGRSLTRRLILTSAAMAIVLLAIAALLLATLFQQALERNFDARLRAVLDGLPASLDLLADGQLSPVAQLSDTRFSLPWSGWYWQVYPVSGEQAQGLASESLLGEALKPRPSDLEKRDKDGIATFYIADGKGQSLRAMEQRLRLFGSSGNYSILVAGNFDELKTEITAFRRALYTVLAVLGLGLILGNLIQIRVALRPLAVLRGNLAGIRNGEADHLTGEYPREIRPVVEELNMLIKVNGEIIERARTQVGNLAHALKTPLSVLTNEAAEQASPLATKVTQQVVVMRDQINLYLDRARRAARAQIKATQTEVEPVLSALTRTIMRINRDRGISIDLAVPQLLKFRGEAPDLEEMAGNLIDNAAKWAQSRVTVRAEAEQGLDDTGRLWLVIMVDDDGPGLAPDAMVEALKRGRRLDETKPGSGLGLSIVNETAAMYGGQLSLDRAPAGGLRARLRLPVSG